MYDKSKDKTYQRRHSTRVLLQTLYTIIHNPNPTQAKSIEGSYDNPQEIHIRVGRPTANRKHKRKNKKVWNKKRFCQKEQERFPVTDVHLQNQCNHCCITAMATCCQHNTQLGCHWQSQLLCAVCTLYCPPYQLHHCGYARAASSRASHS